MVKQPLGEIVPKADGGIVWEFFKERPRLGGGFGYLDGSCDTSVVREARRGGWGIALFSREGEKEAAVRGPIWHSLPQTPLAADSISLGIAVQILEDPTVLYGACVGVVRAGKAMFAGKRLGKGLQYEGVLLHGKLDPEAKDASGCIEDLRWIKSHQDASAEGLPEEERRHIVGNDEADALAKQAAQEARE